VGLALGSVLAAAPFPQARPTILVEAHRSVSWVHSSEIYDIAPLLDGGELLLTTGLGLVGADEDALVGYVDELATHGVAAIGLELGRTFVQAPPALVAACREWQLGLAVLNAVVPFVRLVRAGNLLLLDHEAEGLRGAAATAEALMEALMERRGVRALVDRLVHVLGTPIQLVDRHGRVVAGPAGPFDDPVESVELELAGEHWGRLVAADTCDSHLLARLMAARAPLQLALGGVTGTRGPDGARTLLLDLVRGTVDSAEEVSRRATTLGLAADQPVAAIVVVMGPELAAPLAVEGIQQALRSRLRTDVVSATADGVLAVVHPSVTQRSVASEVLAAIDAELGPQAVHVRHLAVGPAVGRLDQVATSFGVALLAATTGRRLNAGRRLLLPIDVALHGLLLESDDAALERFLARVLGPLLEHDASSTAPLLPTLIAYHRAGRSKAAAARRLRVRRQTVHDRLERIALLLDLSPDDPATDSTLELATLAWQVRSSGVTEP
jgi:PucR family transcriptional regulator, purine catabolism regulatory protein